MKTSTRLLSSLALVGALDAASACGQDAEPPSDKTKEALRTCWSRMNCDASPDDPVCLVVKRSLQSAVQLAMAETGASTDDSAQAQVQCELKETTCDCTLIDADGAPASDPAWTSCHLRRGARLCVPEP
jgi:hypothetical protein